MESEGAKIEIVAPIRATSAPTPKPDVEKPVVKEEPKDEPKSLAEEKAPRVKLLSEQYSPATLVDSCPGLNDSTAAKVLAKFKTMAELSEASNVDLRSLGIRSNYFNKVRAWAKGK